MALTTTELHILRFVNKKGATSVAGFLAQNGDGYGPENKSTIRIAMNRLSDQGFLRKDASGENTTYKIGSNVSGVDFDSLSAV